MGGIIVPGSPPAGYVKTAPSWRPQILRCRFTIEAPTTDPPSDAWFKMREAFANEAATRFVEDMAKRNWSLQGQLRMKDEPVSSRVIADGRARELAPIDQAYEWEYEMAGRFVCLLMPTQIIDVKPKNASRYDLYGTKDFKPIGPSETPDKLRRAA